MSKLLEKRNDNDKKTLIWNYKSIREIDDVILQLLNEADIEGFIKSRLNKDEGYVSYDISGYVPFSDIQLLEMTSEDLLEIIKNIYRLLVYLEDSFIDIDYVMYDMESIFVDIDSNQIYLIVLPCQSALETEETLTDFLEKLILSVGMGHSSKQSDNDKILAKIRKGVRSLDEFQEIIAMLGDGNFVKEEPKDEWEILKSAVREESPEEMTVFNLQMENLPEDEQESFIEDIQEEAADEIQEEIRNSEIEDEIREKMRAEVTQEIREELRAEVVQEVREELRAEVVGEIREELRVEVVQEVREELRAEVAAELCEQLREEITREVRASVVAETEKTDVLESETEKIPYLIRKKTGEIIPLNQGTFIIGKMSSCCDYVIMNNNTISRLHAVIKYQEADNVYMIFDCYSTNHTYVNGKLLKENEAMVLLDQMHIHLATEEFIFCI